jgi:threonine/homoserine/homoserine lactone efflux protein
MLTFAVAVFFLLITPGPGVLSLAGVGSAFGMREGLRYLAGLFVGTNLVALAVVSGLAAIVLADPRIRTVLLIASALYLCWLAAQIAFSGSRIAFIERPRPPGFLGGLALQGINPKAYAVNTALFSGFAFAPHDPTGEVIAKFVLVNAIWLPIHGLWLLAGITLNRLDLAPRIQSRINMGMAASMLVVVGLALLSQR